MRKIIVGARVSMDGVMQAPSGPIEDDVLADCREQARTHMERRVSWVGAALCSRRVDRPHPRRSASPGRRSPVRQC
jgi:hypothetical protein